PLQYWATAASFKIFGEDEWTARLWSGLTGFLGVLLAGFTARRLFGPGVGLAAAAIQASCFLYFGIAHINTLDMGLTFFLQAMLSAFLLAQAATPGSRAERNAMLAAWAAAACAVLSKGLVSLVLPGATLVAYSLLTRDFSPWRRLHALPGLALFLAIAAPWHIAASIANPEFARFYFIHEHFERFLTKVHGRYQPWWYFIPILALGALPWTGMMLAAAGRALRGGTGAALAPRFLLLWSVITFVFFSASSSKLPSYVLPILPALSLLAALWLRETGARALMWHILPINLLAAAALIALPAITRYADAETPHAMIEAYGHWLWVSALLWLLGSLAALALAWRQCRQGAMLALAAGAFLAWIGVVQGHEKLGRSNSSHHIAMQIKDQVSPDAPFYSVRTYEQTLPFYLKRTLTLVQFQDEMAFGLKQEPALWVPTVEAFMEKWRAHPVAWAVMDPGTFEELRQAGLPMHIAARDTRRVIVRTP
ncbi:MAG: hypothetical protein RIR70_1008, partial [Pseudomonadota bacterium]